MNTPCALALRLAQPQDARPTARLSRDLIEQGLPWRYTPGRIASLIADPDCSVLVATQGPQLQGFAVMHFGDQRAHLMLLCVRAAVQRRGIGRRLIDWLLLSAQVAGMQRVELELRADNEPARAFYQRLAFTETARLPDYYRSDLAALRMVRVLRPAEPS